MWIFFLAGNLRTEKVELAAQVRKQQTRIQHLETMIETLEKEVNKTNFLLNVYTNGTSRMTYVYNIYVQCWHYSSSLNFLYQS